MCPLRDTLRVRFRSRRCPATAEMHCSQVVEWHAWACHQHIHSHDSEVSASASHTPLPTTPTAQPQSARRPACQLLPAGPQPAAVQRCSSGEGRRWPGQGQAEGLRAQPPAERDIWCHPEWQPAAHPAFGVQLSQRPPTPPAERRQRYVLSCWSPWVQERCDWGHTLGTLSLLCPQLARLWASVRTRFSFGSFVLYLMFFASKMSSIILRMVGVCLGFIIVLGRAVACVTQGLHCAGLGWLDEPCYCPWVFPADLLPGAVLFAVHPSRCLHSFPFYLSPACTWPACGI